jgi:hypothetical protein
VAPCPIAASHSRKRISRKLSSLHECVLPKKSATSARPISAGPATTPTRPWPASRPKTPSPPSHHPGSPGFIARSAQATHDLVSYLRPKQGAATAAARLVPLLRPSVHGQPSPSCVRRAPLLHHPLPPDVISPLIYGLNHPIKVAMNTIEGRALSSDAGHYRLPNAPSRPIKGALPSPVLSTPSAIILSLSFPASTSSRRPPLSQSCHGHRARRSGASRSPSTIGEDFPRRAPPPRTTPATVG